MTKNPVLAADLQFKIADLFSGAQRLDQFRVLSRQLEEVQFFGFFSQQLLFCVAGQGHKTLVHIDVAAGIHWADCQSDGNGLESFVKRSSDSRKADSTSERC